MKRLISLILAVFICYSVPVMSVSADTTYEEINEAYTFLNALGIVDNESESMDTYLASSVKRGDFVRYAMLLGGYDASNMSYTYSYYNDVSLSDRNFKYISYAYELGFVSGIGEYMFGPDDNISYNEALKLITCVLDADKIAKASGGYPAGYMLAASKLGIKQRSVADYAILTNADAIGLLYDALFAHTAFDNGENVVVDYSDAGVVLEKFHEVKMFSGVIKSAGGVSLTLDNGLVTGEDEIAVGESKFRYHGNVQDLLGMYADVYYRINEGTDTAVYVDVSDNNVTVIESEDFVSVKNLTIEYTETVINFDTKYKQRTMRLSADCDVVYNGRPYPFYDDSLFDLSGCNGSIRCISSSKGNTADVVIVEAYSNYVVASVDRMNKKVYSRLPATTLDFSAYTQLEVFDSYGNKRSFDDIFASDIISVMRSTDSESAKIITSSLRENRKVTERLDDYKVILDNGKLAVIDFMAREKADKELLLGRLLDISYDYRGRICDFIYTDYEDGIDYGYLIKVGGDILGFTAEVKVKLLRLTNNMEEYFIAEELKLDGDKVTNKEFYETFVLTDSSNGRNYTDMQMIKFAVDKNTGEINYVDSKYLGEKEGNETLTSITHPSASFIMDIGALEGLNAFEKGYFLTIPMPDSSLPPSMANNIPDWEFTSESSIINAGDMGGTFEVVDADEAGWASLLIYRPKWWPTDGVPESLEGTTKADRIVGIVDEYVYTLDNETETVKLTYYDRTGAKKTSLLRYKEFIKKPVKAKDGTITYKNMEKGDLFTYDESGGYINSMALCLNTSDITNEKFFRTAAQSLGGCVCGVAYGASEKGLSLLCTVKEGEGIPDFSSGASYEEIFDVDSRFTRTLKTNFANLVVYDVKNETIKKGTIDDIVSCETDAHCPSVIYAGISLGRVSYMVVINNYR